LKYIFLKLLSYIIKIENKNATNATLSNLSTIDMFLNKSRKTNY
jgi:hypothetical protein